MKKRIQLATQDGQNNTEAEVKKWWHHNPWIRALALVVAVSVITTEIILHLMPSVPAVDVLSPQRLVDAQVQEIFKDPMKYVGQIREAEKLQQDLAKAGEEAEKYIASGEYEKAIEPIGKLIDSADLSEEERQQLKQTRAALYFSSGMFEEAKQSCTEFIEDGYDTQGYYSFMRSVCFLQEEDYKAAREDLLAALAEGYENQALCYVHLSFCENYLEDYEKVMEYAQKAQELGAEESYQQTLNYLITVASLKLERFDDCITYASKLMEDEQYAKDSELYYYRGVSWLTKDEYQKAYDDFKKAIELGEETTVLDYNLGVAALGLGKTDEAKRSMKMVLRRGDEEELQKAAEDILQAIDQQERAAEQERQKETELPQETSE
ncbi:MAG: hypothetical protein Q4B57_03695 [Eubacteriales bacterium]|nr:hypothetical protein [Eubacteriales bacterium]